MRVFWAARFFEGKGPCLLIFVSLKIPQSTFYTVDIKWLMTKWVNEWENGTANTASFCLCLVFSGFNSGPDWSLFFYETWISFLVFFFFLILIFYLLTFDSWHFPFHFSLSFIVQSLLSVSVSLLSSFLCQFLFFYSCDFSLF